MPKILIEEAKIKQVLEALESKDTWGSSIREAKEKAITALREALAEQPAQQEPVAQWQCRHIFRTDNLWENCTEDDAKSLQKATPTFEIRKLYTTPPKRHKLAAAELRRLHEVLQSIGVIAHCGGLAGMSEGEALIAIRKISLPYWNKNSSIAQNRAAIAKATGE